MGQNLLSFVSQMKEELNEFQQWWLIQNELEPTSYPLDLTNNVEWFDQYITWVNNKQGDISWK